MQLLCDDLLLRRCRTADRNCLRKYDNPGGRPAHHGISKDAAPYQLSIETLTPIGKSYWGTGHTACISDFYQSLHANRRFSLNLETMEPSIRLMLGTYESARSGHSVTLIG